MNTAFKAGEKLHFEVRYGVITAGVAVLSVDSTSYMGNTACYKFTSTARTKSFFDSIFKVRDEITSIWDKELMISYKSQKKLREGGYRQNRIHLFYPDTKSSAYMKYSFKKRKFKTSKISINENTQDILSAFYYARTLDYAVGDTISIDVGVDGRNYALRVLIKSQEIMDTCLGEINCFLLRPLIEGVGVFKSSGHIDIWVSADKRRIPVLLKSKVMIGSFKAVLVRTENLVETGD